MTDWLTNWLADLLTYWMIDWRKLHFAHPKTKKVLHWNVSINAFSPRLLMFNQWNVLSCNISDQTKIYFIQYITHLYRTCQTVWRMRFCLLVEWWLIYWHWECHVISFSTDVAKLKRNLKRSMAMNFCCQPWQSVTVTKSYRNQNVSSKIKQNKNV